MDPLSGTVTPGLSSTPASPSVASPLSSSSFSSRPSGQSATPVRSISPMSPRSPLPGQERGYRPLHIQSSAHQRQQNPLPPTPPQQHGHMPMPMPQDDAWGPTSPIRPTHSAAAGGGDPSGASNQQWSSSSASMGTGGMVARPPQTWAESRRASAHPHPDRDVDDDDDKDDDDNRSLAAPASSHSQQQQPPSQPSSVQPFVRIKVLGLDKNRRDIYVKFNAESNLPSYRNSSYRSVSRSYSELVKFSEALAVTCPQSILPALPLAQTSALTNDEDDRLVKQSFQKWFARLSKDPGVLRDDEMRSFIESDFGYTPKSTSKRRSVSTAGGFLTSRGSKLPGENDDDLTLAKAGLAKIEHHLQETSKSIDRLSRARRQLAIATNDIGDQLTTFSTVETYAPLAGGFKRLARTHKSLSDVLIGESGAEMVALGDSFAYQAMNARSAKDTLSSRDSIVDEHRQAVKATITKRRNIEKLKSSSSIRSERVDEALDDLDDSVKHEQLLSQRLAAISSHLAPSLTSHAKNTHEDLLMALMGHARIMTMYEKQILKELEMVRPELKAIKEGRSGVIYQGQVGPRGMGSPRTASSAFEGSPRMQRNLSNASNASATTQGTNGTMASQPILTRPTPQQQQQQQQQQARDTLPSHAPTTAAPVQKRSVRSMASSVVVENDNRQRVDARMAASMLANGF
ncbi:BQ2448_4009 [Microbotryum intermedium]|uniref:BQ2448_4009 protein n=1 Tax=Microbotryum intermedium TaxID=269621 RepID=A0A238FF80_9BASI|nr:BQ2448_4009 [Microbotryum intermedium]